MIIMIMSLSVGVFLFFKSHVNIVIQQFLLLKKKNLDATADWKAQQPLYSNLIKERYECPQRLTCARNVKASDIYWEVVLLRQLLTEY